MSDLQETMIDLAEMINWYWSNGTSDQEAARVSLNQALEHGSDLEAAGQSVYYLAGYYWSDGNRGQIEMLERLEALFGSRQSVIEELRHSGDLPRQDHELVYNPS
jgi:hypothetical protein